MNTTDMLMTICVNLRNIVNKSTCRLKLLCIENALNRARSFCYFQCCYHWAWILLNTRDKIVNYRLDHILMICDNYITISIIF